MTPERLEEMRQQVSDPLGRGGLNAWWANELIDELDRLRAAAGTLQSELSARIGVLERVPPRGYELAFPIRQHKDGGALALRVALDRGRELGLFSEPSPGAETTAKTEPGGHG